MELQSNNMLKFTDDFIFSLVMRDPKICRGLLERILPEEEFSDIEFLSNEHPLYSDAPITVETQKTLNMDYDSHGVRFDAYIRTEDIWAEIEMQTYTGEHIGKRSRYYQANMDMDFLDSGKPYSKLKRSYVIFICTFDYKGKGEPVYHFQNFDITTGIYLGDDTNIIILNTNCSLEKVPDKLKPLYAYINDSKCCEDAFIKELDSSVQKYNGPEWRKKYMTLQHIIEREREIAAEAATETATDRVNRLNILLSEAGRTDDLLKAAKDPKYQKKLFEEFDL